MSENPTGYNLPDADEIARRAMGVILPSGEARSKVFRAVDALGAADSATARALLAGAREDLVTAHKAQTAVVQGEARGEVQPYSVLFTHAQDVLMTAMSEESLVSRFVGVFETLSERIAALENTLAARTEER